MFPLATQLLSWYSKIVPTEICYVPSSDLSGFRSMTWNIKLCLLLLSFHISFEQKIFRENCSDAIDTTSLPPLQSVPCSVRWLMQVKSGQYNSFLLKACCLYPWPVIKYPVKSLTTFSLVFCLYRPILSVETIIFSSYLFATMPVSLALAAESAGRRERTVPRDEHPCQDLAIHCPSFTTMRQIVH